MIWLKVFKKALKAGIISGVASAGITQDMVTTIGIAMVGSLCGGIENWFKNRGK